MGLGASFRPKEKERTKEGEKAAKKKKGKDGKENDKDEEGEVEGPAAPNPPLSPGGDTNTHGSTSGWSWILEEWYCHGLGQSKDGAGTSSASELYDSQATKSGEEARTPARPNLGEAQQCEEAGAAGAEKKKKLGEKKHKHFCKDKSHVGPYELLVKERLMGIYVAVFIYRDLKPLVRGQYVDLSREIFLSAMPIGISKSSVSTGMIGGRVGNKGGVGISINLDGTTLLFVNAHLAGDYSRHCMGAAHLHAQQLTKNAQ